MDSGGSSGGPISVIGYSIKLIECFLQTDWYFGKSTPSPRSSYLFSKQTKNFGKVLGKDTDCVDVFFILEEFYVGFEVVQVRLFVPATRQVLAWAVAEP